MHINPQMNAYHYNIQEQKRILTKEKLEQHHNNLNRIEKQMLEDYNKRVERMKEVSQTPITGSQIRKSVDILC